MCEKEQKQKQPLENGDNWKLDGTFIGGNYKIKKLEVILHAKLYMFNIISRSKLISS
jgi:hypothetical protein